MEIGARVIYPREAIIGFERDRMFRGSGARIDPTDERRTIWHTVTRQWLKTIDGDKNKRIIWMRACQMSFPKIARHLGLSRQTVIVRYKTATGHLAERLNAMPDIAQESG